MLLEFVPTASRGVFLVGIEGFWTIGTIIQGLLAFLLLNSLGWRAMLAISATPLGKYYSEDGEDRGKSANSAMSLSEYYTKHGSEVCGQNTRHVH
jgi:hypothetical protein